MLHKNFRVLASILIDIVNFLPQRERKIGRKKSGEKEREKERKGRSK